MCTDMNTCTQPLTRVICLCMLCAVSESVELLSRAHPLNVVVLYIELSCLYVHLHCVCICVVATYILHVCAHALCTVSVHSCLLVSVCVHTRLVSDTLRGHGTYVCLLCLASMSFSQSI